MLVCLLMSNYRALMTAEHGSSWKLVVGGREICTKTPENGKRRCERDRTTNGRASFGTRGRCAGELTLPWRLVRGAGYVLRMHQSEAVAA